MPRLSGGQVAWLARLVLAASWLGNPGISFARNDGNAGIPGNAVNVGSSAGEHYLGIAYGATDGLERYREEHWVWRDAAGPRPSESRLVLYRCPDGTPFARKWVQGGIDDPAPDYAFMDQRDGYREGVETRDGARYVYVSARADAQVERRPLQQAPDAVINAGFDAWVRTHWEAATATLNFLVPSRLSFMPLAMRTLTSSDSGIRIYRLKLDAWYGFAAPTLQVSYDVATHRLRRFVGPSDIHDDNGATQSVRIEFPPAQRLPPPSKAQMDAAAAAPLPPLHTACGPAAR